MSCFELKGGIGSASRRAPRTGHVVGALVLANFGRLAQLTLRGVPIGKTLAAQAASTPSPAGSIIVVIATDAPLEHRQLRRVALRAAAGIARTGSNFAHGSGDIVVAFSTAEPLVRGEPATARQTLRDDAIDPLFDAAAESTEQAIVHALFAARTVAGRDGHVREAITERFPDWRRHFP
jgi:D-aminopeptidase